MSVPAVFVVRSPTASLSEYGDDVREAGMTSVRFSVPLPADSSVSTRSPRSVPVLMWAVVSDPSGYLLSMVNATRASPSSSETSVTAPTLIPDSVTSLPTMMPPASANSALYCSDVA